MPRPTPSRRQALRPGSDETVPDVGRNAVRTSDDPGRNTAVGQAVKDCAIARSLAGKNRFRPCYDEVASLPLCAKHPFVGRRKQLGRVVPVIREARESRADGYLNALSQ